MLKAYSYIESVGVLEACLHAVSVLHDVPDLDLEVLHDALTLFAQTPAWHGCDADADFACLFALALRTKGYDHLHDQYKVTEDFYKRPNQSGLVEDKVES